MKITNKGQVTIPRAIREKSGLKPNTEVQVEFDGTHVLIRRAWRKTKPGRGERLVAAMRGRGDVEMTTDEILALTRE